MFTINDVITHQHRIKLPALVSAGSLIFIIILVLSTDPVQNIGWAILFFGLAFIFLISFIGATFKLQKGKLTPDIRHRITLVSSFIVICLMLRSAGSLSPADMLVLLLIFSGSIFYFSRRP